MPEVMLTNFRYSLYKGNKKFICPECGKRTFVPFVNTETGEQLPEEYGRCDREINCAYFLNPYKDGYNKSIPCTYKAPRSINAIKKRLSFIKVDLLKQSRTAYKQNNFVQWLKANFGPAITNDLISRYHIGTSKHWFGATIFWQIDKQGKVRTGKIMLYNRQTGRRIKTEKSKYINWVHSVLKLEDFELKQCFFGEHLLNQYPASPVAIVESEKTAIIASIFLPRFIWLSVGSLTNLNLEKCKVLAGRKVFLFPDLNAYDKWKIKSNEISELMPGTSFVISDFLQAKAPEADKQKGLDLADYLIKNQQRNSTVNTEITPNKKESLIRIEGEKSENSDVLKTTFVNNESMASETHFKPFTKEFTPLWDITELEADYKALHVPEQPIKINQYGIITNVKNFIASHFEVIKQNNGNPVFTPYYQRLVELKLVLKTEKNGK